MAETKAGTPLMRQYLEIKRQHPDSIVLFRMGDFFETFQEDAKITAKILGIVLTKRANGAAADVPLAGFPHHALDNYLPKLVQAGYRVAICEQVEDPKLAKGIVKREVTEVVTPGTLTADRALNDKSNQYLACLYSHRGKAGYAVLDQSTGEFLLGECEEDKITESLRKYSPREILIGESVSYSLESWYRELLPFITQVEDWVFNFDQSYRTLTDHFQTTSLKGFGCEDLHQGITAGGALFYHLRQSLNTSLKHISTLQPILNEGVMGLDGFTIRNLEVFKSLATQGTHGTLIDILDETKTAGGGRLLKQWLNRPLTDIHPIEERQKIVKAFYQNKRLMNQAGKLLSEVSDIERIIGKINRGKVSPRDIIALGISLQTVHVLSELLKSSELEDLIQFADQFLDTSGISDKIVVMMNADAPAQLNSGNVIAKGIDEDLDELRTLASGGKDWLTDYANSERETTGISSLKIGFNKVFGYYIDVTKTHQDKVPETYIRKQTLVNSERYITPELKEYEEKILSAEEKIEEIERRIFDDLCQFILNAVSDIQTNAKLLSRLDILCTFGKTAITNKYCCPDLSTEGVLEIRKGRHPVVEKLLPPTERFVPNDVFMNTETEQIHLITGPNMAGKSTYLRQIGLLILMAQIGSFIPAKSATIGVVDKLFTRVGASDNLAGGESTFLVEMNEAANILNNVTHRSVILLDEIGRGTATYDGLSLAWAITEYLHEHSELAARTLFATHYHELTDLENTLDRLKNYHVAVKEFGDKIIFLRTIQKGSGDKSYGINVAKMAGLPSAVIHRANEILQFHLDHSDGKSEAPPPADNQISLFEKQENALKQSLGQLNINEMTPLEALKKLDDLKKEHGL